MGGSVKQWQLFLCDASQAITVIIFYSYREYLTQQTVYKLIIYLLFLGGIH